MAKTYKAYFSEKDRMLKIIDDIIFEKNYKHGNDTQCWFASAKIVPTLVMIDKIIDEIKIKKINKIKTLNKTRQFTKNKNKNYNYLQRS